VGYVEGLLGGFMGRKREVETENIRQAELANAREAKVYEALINSPDDEIRTAAITGLLTTTQKPQRAGGLRGWIGEMAANPAYEKIRGLVNTPVEVDEPIPPGGQISAQPTGSLAQSATAATQVGAPPLTAIEPATREAAAAQMEPGSEPYVDETVQAPIQGAPPISSTPGAPSLPGGAAPVPGGTPGTQRVTRPRQVFMTEEERTLRQYSARERGEILGVVAAYEAVGLSHEDAVKRAIAERERSRGLGGAGGYQSIPGQMPDGTPAFGVFDRARGVYIDPATQRPLAGFQPRTTTGSTSLGADRESIAREMFGKPAAQLSTAQMAQVNDRLKTFSGEKAGAVTSGRGEAAAGVPLSTQQRFQATTDLSKQWTEASSASREMKRQYGLMKVGLDRYEADPIGGSQAVLVTFQKILDPTSVVRESEYARSPQGLALLDRLEGLYERYSKGGAGVPKPVLAEMVKTAEGFLTEQNIQSGLDAVRQRIQDTATSYEIDPRLVLGRDLPATVAAPPPGATQGAAPPAPGGAPPPTIAAPPTTATAPAKASGLDTPVPKVFVDANGNLVYR